MGDRERVFYLGLQTRFRICATRDGSWNNKYTSTEAGLEYRKVNREARRRMQAAKEEWTEEQCNNIKKGMMSENNKEAYNTIRLSTRPNNVVSSHRRQQWKHPGGERGCS